MSVSDEERRDAEKTGELLSKKLFAIMDLQADIDAMLRDKHPTPFGSKNWQYACLEAKQRVVAMSDGNMGCPHEEGQDFPHGEDCPFCPFWKEKQGSSQEE